MHQIEFCVGVSFDSLPPPCLSLGVKLSTVGRVVAETSLRCAARRRSRRSLGVATVAPGVYKFKVLRIVRRHFVIEVKTLRTLSCNFNENSNSFIWLGSILKNFDELRSCLELERTQGACFIDQRLSGEEQYLAPSLCSPFGALSSFPLVMPFIRHSNSLL